MRMNRTGIPRKPKPDLEAFQLIPASKAPLLRINLEGSEVRGVSLEFPELGRNPERSFESMEWATGNPEHTHSHTRLVGLVYYGLLIRQNPTQVLGFHGDPLIAAMATH